MVRTSARPQERDNQDWAWIENLFTSLYSTFSVDGYPRWQGGCCGHQVREWVSVPRFTLWKLFWMMHSLWTRGQRGHTGGSVRGEAAETYLAEVSANWNYTKLSQSPGVLSSISDGTALLMQSGNSSGGREKMLVFNTVSIHFSL